MAPCTEIKRTSFLPLAGIRPAPENETLYRPVDPEDPDVQALAESIRKIGIQEPIVVSRDGFILSGHRRYVAAQIAGLVEVPARVHAINRGDDHDGFVELLREFNRQRIKSFDELVREEVVSADPEEAYSALIEHRQQQTKPTAGAMTIGEVKTRARITQAKLPLLNAVIDIINDMRPWWPTSERAIHYRLLNNPPLKHASKSKSQYVNDKKSYYDLTNLITRARLEGIIPWKAIHDPTRPVTTWRTHRHVGAFIRDQFDGFLKNYWRDLQQSQAKHVEILVEKNTAERIVIDVASKYTIPVTSGRGFCSLPPHHAISERFARSGKSHLVLLIVSDHDPEGVVIARSFARSMRDDYGIANVEAVKVAITPEQVLRFALPPGGKAKPKSKNYPAFKQTYGDTVYELEAISPEQLQMVLREAIEAVIDRDALNREIAQEKKDAAELDVLRRRVFASLPKMDTHDEH